MRYLAKPILENSTGLYLYDDRVAVHSAWKENYAMIIKCGEWKRGSLEEGKQFAILTDIIYKAWAGKSAKEYKKFKGLKKENLRDHMTNRELVLNMLAVVSTKDISMEENPETFDEHKGIAARGGNVAGIARKQLEKELGHTVISFENAKPDTPRMPDNCED